MIIKLAAIGALGYFGYRHFQKQAQQPGRASSVALAGGPLSDQARIQSDPSVPPVATLADETTPSSH